MTLPAEFPAALKIRCLADPEYRVTLQIVKLVGIEAAPHCIRVVVVPLTKATDPPAPCPSTVPVVTVPADLPPVLPTHVSPAHLLSNFSVTAFQSDAREVMKGLLRASTGSNSDATRVEPYEPAAHGAHAPLVSE